MVSIFGAALNAETSPHLKLLADVGHECLLAARSLDLLNDELMTIPTGDTSGRREWRREY